MTRTFSCLELLQRSSLWAIRPEALSAAINFALGQTSTSEWEAAAPSFKGQGSNKVAVIPVQGVLTNDGPAYFGSNYLSIASAAEKAALDPDVKRIVLAVDSPGGEVTGCPEAAAALAAVAKVKPVSAIVEGQACSAAYWLASMAGDITLTPSGEVGSVGIRMVHADVSKMLADKGITITELHAGEFKTEFTPYAPLTDAAKESMQSRLDARHAEFIGAIASARGSRASTEMQKSGFGGGRTFSSAEAATHGLVDKVQSSRDFYKALVAPSDTTADVSPNFPIRARLEIERSRG